MTTTTPTRYLDHILIGTPEQVSTIIRSHHQAGTFIAMGPPRPVAPADPRIRVHVRLCDTTAARASFRQAPAATRPRSTPAPAAVVSVEDPGMACVARPTARPRARRLPAVAAAVVTALIGVVYAIGHILARLTADTLANAAPTVVGFLTIAAILAALLGGARSGRGHCPGCD